MKYYPRRIKYEIGQRFHQFIVLSPMPTKTTVAGRTYTCWKCKCDCGKEFITTTKQIQRGRKSCGCASKGTRFKKRAIKVVCISDTHCRLRNITLPAGDILIHAGDLTFQGNVAEISQELRELGRIAKNFKATFLIAGNHDWLPYHNRPFMQEMCDKEGIVYLQDTWAVYEGLVIYGSPHQPEFCDWAFNVPRGPKLAAIWEQIPDKVDILVTHGPPAGIRDKTPYGEKVGCEDLWKRVLQVRPKLHVFGHIHAGYGITHFDGITFVNASTCTEQYRPTNQPIIIELE